MTMLKVLKYGDKILRTPSKDVHKISSKIQKLIDDMTDTMYDYNGVGLAAPQVGLNYRLFIIDTREDENSDLIVFINPKIIKRSGAVESEEGCLSFPEAYTKVRRYSDVTVKALDRRGKPFILEAKDGCLLAIAIQHENDHLDGILFVDHSRNRFATDEELAGKNLLAVDPNYLLDEDELEKLIQEQESCKDTIS